MATSSKAAFDLPMKTRAHKARARRILDGLMRLHPDAHCALDYDGPHQLLVATILSAQATDVAVNKATPTLFATFPTPADYAAAGPRTLQPYIRSLGFFRNKAIAIHEAMRSIVNDFGGEVPATMDELLTLRGVARKTANVVLGNAYGINVGVVVDTHVTRLSTRFGLSSANDPKKIEPDLMALFPRQHWTLLGHLLIFHGRRVCKARAALCAEDPLCRKYCSNSKASEQKKAKIHRGGPRRTAEKRRGFSRSSRTPDPS